MRMNLKWWALGLCVVGLTACSSNQVLRGPLDISIGQQLIDLKTAHTNGAISDREYDQQRKQLIRNAR